MNASKVSGFRSTRPTDRRHAARCSRSIIHLYGHLVLGEHVAGPIAQLQRVAQVDRHRYGSVAGVLDGRSCHEHVGGAREMDGDRVNADARNRIDAACRTPLKDARPECLGGFRDSCLSPPRDSREVPDPQAGSSTRCSSWAVDQLAHHGLRQPLGSVAFAQRAAFLRRG